MRWRINDVAVVAVPIPAADVVASAAEEAAIAARFSPGRRREWLAGREAGRLALAELGCVDAGPILADERGAPRLLPSVGLSLSLAHDGDFVIAAAARFPVGVDLLGGGRFDSAHAVVTARWRDGRAGAVVGPCRWPSTAMAWTAWEALAKLSGEGMPTAMHHALRVQAVCEASAEGAAEGSRLTWFAAAGGLACLARRSDVI